MTAITHDLRVAAATARPRAKAEKSEKKGFFARLFDAMAEARMRQVEREIRLYQGLLPRNTLADAGYKATYRDAKKLPFVK